MTTTTRVLTLAAAAVATGTIAGCGGGADPTDREIVLDIQPQGPEGTSGTLSLAKSGEATSVVVEALVASGGGQQGAAFYTGTCENFDEGSAIEVGPLEEGYGALTLDRPIDELIDGTRVLVITRSPEDNTPIGCAPIDVE